MQIETARIESDNASEKYNSLSCEKDALEEELANTRQKLDEALKVIDDSKTYIEKLYCYSKTDQFHKHFLRFLTFTAFRLETKEKIF